MCAAHLLPSNPNQQVAIQYEWRTHTLSKTYRKHTFASNKHTFTVRLRSTHCSTNFSIDFIWRAVSAINVMRVPIHNANQYAMMRRAYCVENGNHAVASIDLLCGKLYNRFSRRNYYVYRKFIITKFSNTVCRARYGTTYADSIFIMQFATVRADFPIFVSSDALTFRQINFVIPVRKFRERKKQNEHVKL